jgi:hypothetical protein
MNIDDYKTFKWIHDYTNTNLVNKDNESNMKKKNIIYRELIIRNMVMNVTSPKLFKYIKKNKI